MRRHVSERARFRQDREGGQAITEFAVVLLPVLLLVAGIIQFGIALNYWLDENRLANQGARWAVVNSWPTCPRSVAPTNPPSYPPAACGTQSLQRYIACQPLPTALKPTVTVSFPNGPTANKRGDPVQVSLSTPFKFVPIVGIGTITLRAKATMRLEQDATKFTSGSYTATTCP